MRSMAAPSKYPDELRERATRMAVEARRDPVLRAHAPQRQGRPIRRRPLHPAPRRGWGRGLGRFDRRLHGEIGMIPPVELEDIYHRHQTVPATADAALASLQQTRGDSLPPSPISVHNVIARTI